ncbi:MAG: hypothetical protein ACE5J7_05340 [Candidatus Aenigmatarchaeota archaeon]
MVEQNIVLIGFILLVLGIALIIIGSILSGKGETKWAVGGFIGPLPFGVGSSMQLAVLVTIIAFVIFILLIAFRVFG